MLEARSAVKSLHAYRPPLAGRQGLRLDFNESTIGCSPRVLTRLRSLDADVCTIIGKDILKVGRSPSRLSVPSGKASTRSGPLTTGTSTASSSVSTGAR